MLRTVMGTAGQDPKQTVPVGLCLECAKSKSIVSGRGSSFYLCTDPKLPKYPPLPVLRCVGFTKKEASK